jgi:hypothetical protein
MVDDLNAKYTGTQRPSHVSDDEPSVRGEEMTVARRPNEELIVTATPWYKQALALLTIYGELSAACFAEEFAPVRARLQQEWIFVAGFVSRFIIVFFLDFLLIAYSM